MQTLNFIFNSAQLRIYGSVEEPIFVVNDICEIIGIDNQSRMIMRVKKDEFFRPCTEGGSEIPQYQGRQLAIINEYGLYEILFRSDSEIAQKFRREISVWLKQQRLQQNILQKEKILELEGQNEQLNQKIIDQQLKHQQELENRERIYSVISIHKIDDEYDFEDDEQDIDTTTCLQMVCVTTNPEQIFRNYTAELDKHYREELNYRLIILQDKLKKEEALQFKNDYLNNVLGCNKTQHHCCQWVTPLFD